MSKSASEQPTSEDISNASKSGSLSQDVTQADQEGDDNSAVAAKRSWPVFKRLFASYVLPHWKVGLLAIMAMLAFGATQVGIIASVQPFLDDGLVERDTAVIRMFALVFLLLLVVQGIAYFFSHYLSGWLSRQLIKNLRLDAHSRLLNMPESAFDQFSSGRLVSKLTYQAEKTAGAVVKAIVTLFKDAVRVIGILGYMIYLSPWLMLIAGLVLPFVGGVIAYINKRFRKLSERIHGAVGGIGAIAEETVTANQEIKLFGQNERERKRFDSYNEKNRRQFMKFAATKFAAVPAIRLIISVALAIVIFLVTVDEIVEAISVGQIASFIVAMTMLNRPLRDLVKLNATMQNGLTAARSIFEIVDIKPEPDDGSKRIGRADGHIVFDQVKFSYDADREVLKGISFEAKPGQTVALTGPSGGGKSTLISLIPRFYEPTSGVIELDGVPLFEYKLADLRKQIALVDQNVTLFNTSVAENIAVGAVDDISREQVRRAAAAANALEFIENLPHGFDTQIGQDGVMLSGGQRQRLAIARAILKDAPILLLDEATSALDNESEYNVHAALERLMADRTSIVIAHRLSTVENADQILFLEDGEVVEQGSHSELLDREGRYAELYRMQYSENG